MKIDDNGTVRDMTPDEEAVYLAQMAGMEVIEDAPTPEDYEAALAKLGVE